MHQIKGNSAINNHFVDEVEGTQEGTVLSADWLNTVQDEICNAITISGLSLNEPDKDDAKQLYNCIKKIVQDSLIDFIKKIDLDNFSKSLPDNYVTKDFYDKAIQDINMRVDDNKRRIDEITKQNLKSKV